MTVTTTLQALSLVEKVELVQGPLRTRLEGLTEHISECEMDVESTWIPTWHQMEHVSSSLGIFS